MEVSRAAYGIPIDILTAFRVRCQAEGLVQTVFVSGCMRAFVEGRIRWESGAPVVSPTQVSASQTVLSTVPPSRGRPPKEGPPKPGDPGWEAYAAKRRDEFRATRHPMIDPNVPSIKEDPAAWDAYAAKKREEEEQRVPKGFASMDEKIRYEIKCGNTVERARHPEIAAEMDAAKGVTNA